MAKTIRQYLCMIVCGCLHRWTSLYSIDLIRHNLFPNRLSGTEGHCVLLMAQCNILNQPPHISVSFNNTRQNSAQ